MVPLCPAWPVSTTFHGGPCCGDWLHFVSGKSSSFTHVTEGLWPGRERQQCGLSCWPRTQLGANRVRPSVASAPGQSPGWSGRNYPHPALTHGTSNCREPPGLCSGPSQRGCAWKWLLQTLSRGPYPELIDWLRQAPRSSPSFSAQSASDRGKPRAG